MPETSARAGGVCGLLGGTFDPIHRAHLALASAALGSGLIDRLRIVPAGRPPHRAAPRAGGAHRLAMVRLGVASLPSGLAARCVVDAGEVERVAPSYTIDTLERIRAELGPRQPLALILGADAFLGLPSWHRWQDLLDHAHLLVAARPGHALERERMPEALRRLAGERHRADGHALSTAPAGFIADLEMPPVDCSATEVRRILAGPGGARAAAKLLPADVVRYILDHHLYAGTDGYTAAAANRH